MTRLLSSKEIENILDFIKPNVQIPVDCANVICEKTKEKFRSQLVNVKVYPEIIPELKEKLIKHYYESVIQPGESVGILAAQSIGEKNTQSALNSFHTAGQSDKTTTQGVPRFQELLSATRNPKNVNCKIFFKEGNDTLEQLRDTIGHEIVSLKLKNIIISSEICMNKKPEEWYESFAILYNDRFTQFKHCISFKMNSKILYKYRLTFLDIITVLENSYDDLSCVFSPIEKEQIDVFIDVSNIKFPEEKMAFITPENSEEIYIEECVHPIFNELQICGIVGIESIYYLREKGEWYIETDGSNFRELLGCSIIDTIRLHSNNMWDIYETLGIEATREFLIKEFLSVMEGINLCHVKLLVDKMTHLGIVSSISRYTLKKDKSGPISKSTFEQSMETLIQASFGGEIEETKGVSAAIICGKRAGMGTGIIDLKMDLNMIQNCTKTLPLNF